MVDGLGGQSVTPDLAFGFEDTITIGDLGDPDGGRRPNRRRDSLLGLAVVAALITMVIAMSAFRNSPDSSADDSASEQQPTATPEPTTPAESTETPATPRPRPTATPRPEFIDAMGDVDFGAGWLASINRGGYPVALNLETGAQVQLEQRVSTGSTAFFTPQGVYRRHSGPRQEFEWIGAWFEDAEPSPGRAEPLPVDHFLVGSFTDLDRGPVVVSLANEFAVESQYLATALATGETKTIPATVIAVDPYSSSGFFFVGPQQPGPAPGWVVDVDGEVWRWDWDDGWKKLGDGSTLSVSADSAFTQRCDAPNECVVEQIPFDGSGAVELPLDAALSVSTISPDHTKGVRIVGGPDANSFLVEIAVVDLATGTELAVISDNSNGGSPYWSPNSDYLIVSDFSGESRAFDATTGEVVGSFRNQPYGGPHPFAFLAGLEQ